MQFESDKENTDSKGSSQNNSQQQEQELEEQDHQRNIRNQYRELLVQTHDLLLKNENLTSTAETILGNLQKANGLFGEVTSTQDAALDAKLLLISSEMGSELARKSRSSSQIFEISDFVSKVQMFLSPGVSEDDFFMSDIQWRKLSQLSSKYSKRTFPLRCLFGSLDLCPSSSKKEISRASQRSKRTLEDQIKPSVISNEELMIDHEGINETTKNIASVFEILTDVGPILFWKFVINPESFSQTVENIFYTAFLAKDGKVICDTDLEEYSELALDGLELGDVVIAAIDTDSNEEGASNANTSRFQHMVTLDVTCWKELIAAYNITTSAIPTRTSSKDAESDRNRYIS